MQGANPYNMIIQETAVISARQKDRKPMSQHGFYFNASRCIKCHACEIACREWNEVEEGPRWREVVTVTSDTSPKPSMMNISMACMHCAEPPCRDACPTGAITKRTDDGIVVVDPEKCIGCGYCLWACPYGAPQFGKNGKMQKCNYCSTQGKERAHAYHELVKRFVQPMLSVPETLRTWSGLTGQEKLGG